MVPLLIGAGPRGGLEQRRGQSRSAVLGVTLPLRQGARQRGFRCVCVRARVYQAASKETRGLMLLSRWQADAAAGWSQAGRGLCSLRATVGACGAFCKHSRRLIPNMPAKERKQTNSSNLTVIQDTILRKILFP